MTRPRGPAGWIHPIEREELISRARLLDENDVPRVEIAKALNVSPGMITRWLGVRHPSMAPVRSIDVADDTEESRQFRALAADLETDIVRHASIDTYFDARPPRDICESIAEATGRNIIDRATFQLGPPADSDEVPWYEEQEAPLPVVPASARYYGHYRALYLKWRYDREGAAPDTDTSAAVTSILPAHLC